MTIDDSASGFPPEVEAILTSKQSELEKLSAAFEGLTGLVVKNALQKIELAHAIGDRRAMIKQQIKMETIKSARRIFQTCHQRVCGREAWDEPRKC